MQEFLAILATFLFGLIVTTTLAAGLEQRQLANSQVDESADVRPGIITVTASGYAVPPKMPVQLGFLPGAYPNEI